jgi:hypothetical protein
VRDLQDHLGVVDLDALAGSSECGEGFGFLCGDRLVDHGVLLG